MQVRVLPRPLVKQICTEAVHISKRICNMKKINKAQANQFRKDALRILEDIGAEENTTLFKTMYAHTVQTKYGPLLVSIDSSPSVVYTIFARFVYVKRLRPVMYPQANRFSGKWNFHEYSADECLFEFKKAVSKIAPTGE